MRILTALDRSEYAELVLEHALDRAVRADGAELHIVTVVPDASEYDETLAWLSAIVGEGIATFGLERSPTTVRVMVGDRLTEIARVASEVAAHLLVIGRFHAPSLSEAILDVIDCPTLVVGIDGVVLEPQCLACIAVRRATEGQRLFCPQHAGERAIDPSLSAQLVPLDQRGGLF